MKTPEANLPGLAVDIDDTLADTFRHFAGELELRYGNPEGLTLDEIVKKYGIMPNIPYWQTPEVVSWLESQAVSNEAQERIPVLGNAVERLREIQAVAPVRMYITSRPTLVIEGTRRWLTKNGFPEAEVVTRPESKRPIDGNAWKAEILRRGFPSVAGLVDDNPEVVRALGDTYHGTVFLFGTQTYNGIFADRVYACPDWEAVKRAVFDLWKNSVSQK